MGKKILKMIAPHDAPKSIKDKERLLKFLSPYYDNIVVELLDIDSIDGAKLIHHFNINQHPAIIFDNKVICMGELDLPKIEKALEAYKK